MVNVWNSIFLLYEESIYTQEEDIIHVPLLLGWIYYLAPAVRFPKPAGGHPGSLDAWLSVAMTMGMTERAEWSRPFEVGLERSTIWRCLSNRRQASSKQSYHLKTDWSNRPVCCLLEQQGE
jgi:hypothetical protein